MADIPRKTVTRTAKLASLPLGVAGRVVGGWGRRLVGQDSQDIRADISAKTAEQVFAVLGQLKGGAMKFGQALSVFEAAMPDELAEPYREALTKLQAGAPPMAAKTVHRVLAEQLGAGWAERFAEFQDEPAASASIGQVHRAIWHDGREVAVKVQYPGADEALLADLRQLQRFSRLFQGVMPGAEVKPLITELQDRMAEELDYRIEADNQRAFAAEFDGDPNIKVPRVVASAPKVMVSEWVTGASMAEIIANGTREERNVTGRLLAEFHFSAPARLGLLHADPHPGNYLLTHAVDARRGTPDCSACHRAQTFCVGCHERSGLGTRGDTSFRADLPDLRFHPAGWSSRGTGPNLHAQEARRNITSCASCHREDDCIACHSAEPGGVRASPHPADWRGSARCKALDRGNRRMCLRCHVTQDELGCDWHK